MHAHLMIFDVLAMDGEPLVGLPHGACRERLEDLGLDGAAWSTPATFDDGAALFAAVCERGLEGIVAKQARSTYRAGRHGWIKIKNPGYWRRPAELAAMQRRR